VLVASPRARDGLADDQLTLDALVFSADDERERQWAAALEPRARLSVATEGGAGGRNVLVHGAYTAQRALEAGVLDELQIDQIPVLFGGGRRLFEVLPSRIELEIVRVIDTPEATHIRYRVRR